MYVPPSLFVPGCFFWFRVLAGICFGTAGSIPVCCIRFCLAKVLTANKDKALIINADSSTPMLPVWMPERILETDASIGNVLA